VGGRGVKMPYPNLKTATKEELRKFYPYMIFCSCEKCGATWPEASIFAHECGDTTTPIIDAIARAILKD